MTEKPNQDLIKQSAELLGHYRSVSDLHQYPVIMTALTLFAREIIENGTDDPDAAGRLADVFTANIKKP